MSEYLELSALQISNRQRKEFSPKELLELKRSIFSKGLMHAPVLSLTENGYKLIAGERRIRAMTELHEEGLSFNYNGKPIPPFTIPYVTLSDLSLAELMEAELEENIIRADLSFLEACEAKARIHELRTGQNPSQTFVQTAKEVAAKQGRDPAQITSKSAETREIQRAVLITQHRNDPAVAKAKDASAAHKIILDKMEAAMRTKLAHATKTLNAVHTLIRGDCREEMRKLPANFFDIIFSDPPYGIDADSAKGDSKHFYDDSPDNALSIYHAIMSEGFRITKPKAALLLWCDIDHFPALRTFAAQQGWTTWRTPLIYYKGESGHAPWGRAGFVRTYETLLFAVKGARELYRPGGADVKLYNSGHAGKLEKKKLHAAEKPIWILSSFLEMLGLETHTVLDPCCGSGPIFPAAHKLRMTVTGIELDEHYYNVAASRISALTSPEDDTDDNDANDDLTALA